MSEAISTPGPAADGPDQPPEQAGQSFPVAGSLSDEDVLALLDSLGVAGTHDPEGDQEAVAEAEWQAQQDGEPTDEASATFIAEHLPAGPGLAAVLAQETPGGASDFDLPGMAASYRRLAAWAQARELAAVAEIAARRAAANPDIGAGEDGRPCQLPPEAAAEVGLELRMSQYGASAWTDLGCQLRWRLPGTFAALAAGTIDLGRARIIAEATGLLCDEHAAAVERRVLPAAGQQTTGQLRAAVRRAVLAVDPGGAEQRRTDTERHARVGLYPGEEGTATLTGSNLPGIQAAAAMARLTAMARALKSAGAGGGLDLLRAHVFVGLLLGTLPLIPPPAGGPPDPPPPDDQPPPPGDQPPPPGGQPPPDDAPDPRDIDSPDDGPLDQAAVSGTPPAEDTAGGSPCADGAGRGADRSGADDLPGWWPDIPCPGDADAPPDTGDPPDPVTLASHADDEDDDWPQLPSPHWPALPPHLPATGQQDRDDAARARTGLLDVLLPWSTLAGHSAEPGILGRIGPITSLQARQLLFLATLSPATQWRVIVTGDDGRALAVERVRLPRQIHARDPSGNVTGVVGRVTVTVRASVLSALAASSPETAAVAGTDACPLALRAIAGMILRAANRAAARARALAERDAEAGGCAHTTASAAYRPPPRIREHIAARDKTCRFGPCGQPAWRTDLDHTIPWHQGGRTCPCNLDGCCRTHHLIKHLPGWHLDQTSPGYFTWTTPAGRSYLVQPDQYPV